METLLEFIARRREELAQEEKELRRRLSEVLVEQQQLKTFASQHSIVGGGTAQETQQSKKRKRIIKPGTIMFDVIDILDGYPDGLTANEILDRINEIRKYKIERTSLSPQLSRLRQDGYLELVGSIWRILR